MKKEVQTVVYDDELRIEAYRFEGKGKSFDATGQFDTVTGQQA